MGVQDQGCRAAAVLPASLLLRAFVRRNAWETSWGERKVSCGETLYLYRDNKEFGTSSDFSSVMVK